MLKERLRMFEGTSASGFKGFSTGALTPNLQVTQNEFKIVNVNQEILKKMNSDPVASFLQIVNKL
jgi:hypothetical protein